MLPRQEVDKYEEESYTVYSAIVYRDNSAAETLPTLLEQGVFTQVGYSTGQALESTPRVPTCARSAVGWPAINLCVNGRRHGRLEWDQSCAVFPLVL